MNIVCVSVCVSSSHLSTLHYTRFVAFQALTLGGCLIGSSKNRAWSISFHSIPFHLMSITFHSSQMYECAIQAWNERMNTECLQATPTKTSETCNKFWILVGPLQTLFESVNNRHTEIRYTQLIPWAGIPLWNFIKSTALLQK